MLRYRRYRVFLVFALFIIAALYRFTTYSEWERATASSVEKLKSYAGQSYKGKVEEQDRSISEQESISAPTYTPTLTGLAAEVQAAIPKATGKPIGEWELGPETTPTPVKPAPIGLPLPTTTEGPGKKFGLSGQGRHDAPAPLDGVPVIHWQPSQQHFPLPEEHIIPLPAGKPKTLPKIQHAFKDETPTEKADRQEKQQQIKAAIVHSWKGYKEYAWLHDELRPQSGGHRDTFMGWQATKIDSLDTLWIAGLHEEFVEAVKSLEDVDFTTSVRPDIPVFETTIRYLGGLLGAYDVSGAKYEILLKKAQQLGNVLLSAFDTPNRMPITYYNWRPAFAKNPHRAGTRTVLAELGSLAMEFTRLAQLTKENKYYDAVARITNELELMQSKTRVPGLWPELIDTSGCKKPSITTPEPSANQQPIQNQERDRSAPITPGSGLEVKVGSIDSKPAVDSTRKTNEVGLEKRQLNTNEKETLEAESVLTADEIPSAAGVIKQGIKKGETDIRTAKPAVADTQAGVIKQGIQQEGQTSKHDNQINPVNDATVIPQGIKKDPNEPQGNAPDSTGGEGKLPMSDVVEVTPPPTTGRWNPAPAKDKVDCIPQGLESPPYSQGTEKFKFGGAADSTYEYLPKMHILLGGQVDQYSRMYQKAIDAANEHLLIRQMIPDEDRELLFLAEGDVEEGWRDNSTLFGLTYKQTHLLCFTGGMYGIGSKLFGREEDMEIAKKMTDGCVWAYENTESGIMPEEMHVLPCPSRKECAWNETLWTEMIDPWWKNREEQRLIMEANKAAILAQEAADAVIDSAEKSVTNVVDDQDARGATDVVNDSAAGGVASTNAATDDDVESVDKQDTKGPLATRQVIEEPVVPEALADTGIETKHKTTPEAEVRPKITLDEEPRVEPKVIAITSTTSTRTPTTTTATAAQETSYNPFPNHEEYVKMRIEQGRLPVGVPSISHRSYILRPEAIESVFIMYRITGDNHWREKGWKMWQAISSQTKTLYGYSAIKDVTRKDYEGNFKDEMESFALAETFKYFYLLFSTPDTISLDDFVFNTEAHSFRRTM